jgi:hypothetical protein
MLCGNRLHATNSRVVGNDEADLVQYQKITRNELSVILATFEL